MEDNTNTRAMRNERTRRAFDDVFDHVNSFSLYQGALYLGVKLMVYALVGQFMALVFAMGTPKFHCTTPNTTTCPPSKCCENCTSYAFDGPYHSTVSEWNLICDRAYLGATLQSSYFAGMLIGSSVNGVISDSWGRKRCMFTSFAIMIITVVASSFVDCVAFYGLLQFIIGFTLTGAMLSGYIYGMEIVGPEYRTLATCGNNIIWGGFAMVLAALAYLVRDWRSLVLVYTVPGVLIFPFWICIPKSPRWLVAHGHLDEAHAVLMKFGGKKGEPIDSKALRALITEVREDQIARERERTTKHTPLDLLRIPKLRRWTLILCYNWFAVGIVFFGVFLFMSRLAGDIYTNYAVMSAISMSGIPVSWYLWIKIGRRLTHASYFILMGTSYLITLAFYKDYPKVSTGLCVLGYLFITKNFGSIYLITAELYPTILRTTALGTGSASARVGAILAPYIAMAAQLPGVSIALPVTIFGVVAVVAGLLMYWIPETLRAKMHQTIEEAVDATDDYGMPCCGRPLTGEDDTKAHEVREPLVEMTVDSPTAPNCLSSV